MAGGGEVAAAFRSLAEDAAQAGESIGKSMGRWIEDTADIEEENVNRTLAADAENARAISAIRPDPPNLADGGAGADGAGEPSRISQILSGDEPPSAGQSSSGRAPLPPFLKKQFEEGRAFNEENRPRYPHNEVDLATKKRVDSYRPNREIVERKHTQLSDIQPSTARGYIDSLRNKYASGQPIADTPKNRAEGIAGQTLRGRPILEVPPQHQPVPPEVLRHAASRGVIIRDTNGRVYR